MKMLLFSAQGRIARGQFWKGSLLLVALLLAAMVLSTALAMLLPRATAEDGTTTIGTLAMILSGLVYFAALGAMTYSSFCLGIKRFHDRGKPGVWVLIGFVPLIGGVWYLVETGFLKGTDGPNTYGSDPLAGRLPAGTGLAPAR